MKAIRVDLGMLYNLHLDLADTVATIVADAKQIGADTLIVDAINSVYGTFYNTTYPPKVVENGFGKEDLLPALLAEANGLSVIVTMPLTNFQILSDQAAWRSITTDGDGNPIAYNALGKYWQMSCSSSDYSNWLTGLIADLFEKCPSIAGVEINEPCVAPDWSAVPDLNPSAVAAFQAQNPGQPTNGPAWLQFRANALTALIGTVGVAVKGAGKTFGVVQDIGSSGCDLDAFADFSNDIGFDFDGIMNLPANERPDYVAAELIWQQAAAERGCGAEGPDWTGTAAADYVNRAAGRTRPCIHVEMTGFPVTEPTITPTPAQLTESIKSALAVSPDITVFEYVMIKKAGALDAVAAGFGG